MILRRIKRTLLDIASHIGILRFAQMPGHEPGNHLFILAYHRIAEQDSPLKNRLYDLVTATPQQFNQQMKLISDYFHPVTAENVVNALDGGTPLPAQAVLVTVDDGYRDFKDTIVPIARRHGIRPVLFLPTAFVGNGIFWWDRLFNALHNTRYGEVDTSLGHFSLKDAESRKDVFDILANHVRMMPFEKARADIEQLCDAITPPENRNISYVLDWDDLRALSGVVTIASHTHTHPILTHIPLEKARDEIRISRGLIRQQTGQDIPIFAYPDGRDHAVSFELAAMLKEEGITLAFTMSDRVSRLRQDDHQLFPRLVPSLALSHAQFHLRLTALRI